MTRAERDIVPGIRLAQAFATRRRLLTGTGFATIAAAIGLPAIVPPVHSPQHVDAALFADCHAYFAMEAAGHAEQEREEDDAAYAIWDQAHDIYARVAKTRPGTIAGLKAKASVMLAGFEEGVVASINGTMEQEGEWHELGAWRLMHDVLALENVA